MGATSDLSTLSDDQLTEQLREIELRLRRNEAELAQVLAEVDRRGSWQIDDHRSMKGWLKANTNWSDEQVRQRRRLARLIGHLPEVGEALANGHIGVAQAQLLAGARANPRCGDQLDEVIDLLLDQCEQLSYAQAKRCVDHWRRRADQDGAHRDRDHAEAGRTATVTAFDESVHVAASGGGAKVAAELTSIFDSFLQREFAEDVKERDQRYGPDAPASLLPRTAGQRSFDALANIFRTANHAGAEAGGPPTPATVDIIVDQLTHELALHRCGLVNDPVDLPEPLPDDRRCETDTGIPLLPIDVVRAVLTGHVRRVVLDSRKVVTELGRRQRLFTGGARAAVKLMSATCEMPGCDVKVTRTEVDHVAEWVRRQGDTSPHNGANICKGHNRAKSRNGVSVERTEGGYMRVRRRDGTPIAPVGQRLEVDHAPVDPIGTARMIRAMVDALDRDGWRGPG